MKRVNDVVGKSKIHAIALYDYTWNDFKTFRKEYNLSSEGALRVLMDNWRDFDIDESVRHEIELFQKRKDASFDGPENNKYEKKGR